MIRLAPFLGVIVSMGIARPMVAQAPDDRAALERLRGELAATADSAALKAREAAGISRAKLDRDNAVLHVELGFVAYRLAEVTGDKHHYEDAGSEFEWATELKPEWPFPWYGLGLVELAQGEAGSIAMENIRQVLGKDFLTKAADAFARAAQADPSFTVALVTLGETALRQRINARVDVALAALRLASHRATMPPVVLLQLGRLEREAGSDDSALAVFRQFVAAGGDSGIGLFETARVLYDLHRAPSAESSYFAGAKAAHSPDAKLLYRQDVAWAASADEVSALDSSAAQGRLAEALRHLWRSRDLQGAVHLGDALAEHERRFLHAWRHYRLVSRHRHYDVTETYRSDQAEFDDRGIIYLRHGEPDRRAVYTSIDVEPNESWLYQKPEGNVVFHFVARDDVSDFKLIRSLADVLGFEKALQIQTVPGGTNAAGALFASRSLLDPLYAQLGGGGMGAGGLLNRERERGAAAIRLGTTTTDYAPRFAERLDPLVETYALADTAGTGGRLLMVFGLPAKSLEARPLPQGQAYPVEVRVSGEGSDGSVLYHDTTRVFLAPHALRGQEHLSWALSLPAAPGRYTMRVVVTQPGTNAGAVLRVDSVVVLPFGRAGSSPLVSDLVAGRAGSGLVWLNGRDTIALNPLGTYPVDGAVDLYYEVGGLSRGEAYHTRIVVDKEGGRSFLQRLFGGGGPAVNIEFDAAGDSTMTRQHQRVSLKGVGTGRYRLTLDVTVPGRETHHVRTATLTIQKP